MTIIGTAEVAVRPKVDAFSGELERGLKPGLAKAERAAQQTGDRVGTGLGSKLKQTAALIGGAFAVEKVVDFGKEAVHAAEDEEKANLRLQNSIAGNKKLTDSSREAFEKQSLAISRTTAASRTQVTAAQSQLASMGMTQAQILKLTPLIIDYARKTGTDVTSASRLFGRAAEGNTAVLHRLGVQFDKTKAKADPFGTTVDALRQKAGGFATQEGETLTGKMAILSNRFEEVKVKVGTALLPILSKLAGFILSDVVPAISSVAGWFERNRAILGPLIAILGGVVAAVTAISIATKIWAAIQAVLDAELLANPIGLVVLAIAALAAGIIYAYKHSETFRNIVHDAMSVIAAAFDFVRDHWKLFATVFATLLFGPVIGGIVLLVTHFGTVKAVAEDVFSAVGNAVSFMWHKVIKPVFKFIIDTWLTVAGAIVNGAAAAFGWVPGIGPKLRDAAKKFNSFRDTVNDALDGIHRNVTITIVARAPTLNDLLTNPTFTKAVGSSSGPVGSLTDTLYGAAVRAGRASGGRTRGGVPITVGEFGREVFTPDVDGVVTSNASLRNDPDRTTHQLLAALIDAVRASGGDFASALNDAAGAANLNARTRVAW